MKMMILVLSLLAAPLAMANTAKKDCMNYKMYTDIPMTEMKTLVEKKSATVIDVNTKASYESSHIPGAIHFSTEEKNLAQKLPTDKNALIVAYCGGKSCTAWQKAAKLACEMGYTNIKHFSEGIKGWNAQTAPTKKS